MNDNRTLNEIALSFGLNEDTNLFFDVNSADDWTKKIDDKVNAAVIKSQKSTLGGDHNVSIMIQLSLDPKEDWPNKIFQNSRWAQLHLHRDGTLEMYTCHYKLKKMRKTKVKSPEDVIKKINEWIKSVS